MSVYLIFEIRITDPARFEEYRQLVPPVIARYGGKYVVRGGPSKNVEGDWIPERIVILEFDSGKAATDFLHSPEYAPIKQIRLESSISRGIMVDTLDRPMPSAPDQERSQFP